MWIERELASELLELARAFPVVVVVGPRQVGKTSLVEHTFPTHRYVSLDLASNAELAETRPGDFLATYPPPLIVDEVQYAPALLRHLKALVDQHRTNGQIILTGSQDFALMQSLSESLAGRAAVVTLLGLSGQEWSTTQTDPGSSFPDLVWRGSYPALWADPGAVKTRDRWFQGYLATYLERDVRNLLRVGSLRDFQRFLRACAIHTAQTLNMSELARDVGISPTTARQWISVLQASNQVLLLEPYHRSLGKRLVKTPKLYLSDTGLASFLMGFDSLGATWQSPHAGALWETHVVGQWVRWRQWHAPAASLWYWRDQAGHEVDLVVDHNNRLTPIECKLTQRPAASDTRGIQRFRAMYPSDAIARAFIACTSPACFDLAPETTAVPGWKAWDLSLPASDSFGLRPKA